MTGDRRAEPPCDRDERMICESAAGCTCATVYVGLRATDSRNWNPDCPVHVEPPTTMGHQNAMSAVDGAAAREAPRGALVRRAVNEGGLMDPRGHIYEGTGAAPVKPEDAARLDGYLRGRAESDADKREAIERMLRERDEMLSDANPYSSRKND